MRNAADLPAHKMNLHEFLAWSEGVPGRFELHGGRVVEMQSELRAHSLVKRNIERALSDAIQRAGVDCRSLPYGPTVPFDDEQG